jgi:uroporphyrinogen-III synthase
VSLRARGLVVAVVACYETVTTPPDDEGERRLREADVVVIGAPSAWAVAASFIGPKVWVVVPGATTSAVVRERHERVLEGWGPSLAARLATL